MGTSAQQGFNDPYEFNASGAEANQILSNIGMDSNGFISKIMDFMGFGASNEREQRLLEDDRAYERASISSARAWDEYLDSTQVQRRVKDIEAAGLNPWLAVQNGGISTSSNSTADTGGSAKHSSSSGQSKTGLLMMLLGLARLIS